MIYPDCSSVTLQAENFDSETCHNFNYCDLSSTSYSLDGYSSLLANFWYGILRQPDYRKSGQQYLTPLHECLHYLRPSPVSPLFQFLSSTKQFSNVIRGSSILLILKRNESITKNIAGSHMTSVGSVLLATHLISLKIQYYFLELVRQFSTYSVPSDKLDYTVCMFSESLDALNIEVHTDPIQCCSNSQIDDVGVIKKLLSEVNSFNNALKLSVSKVSWIERDCLLVFCHYIKKLTHGFSFASILFVSVDVINSTNFLDAIAKYSMKILFYLINILTWEYFIEFFNHFRNTLPLKQISTIIEKCCQGLNRNVESVVNLLLAMSCKHEGTLSKLYYVQLSTWYNYFEITVESHNLLESLRIVKKIFDKESEIILDCMDNKLKLLVGKWKDCIRVIVTEAIKFGSIHILVNFILRVSNVAFKDFVFFEMDVLATQYFNHRNSYQYTNTFECIYNALFFDNDLESVCRIGWNSISTLSKSNDFFSKRYMNRLVFFGC